MITNTGCIYPLDRSGDSRLVEEWCDAAGGDCRRCVELFIERIQGDKMDKREQIERTIQTYKLHSSASEREKCIAKILELATGDIRELAAGCNYKIQHDTHYGISDTCRDLDKILTLCPPAPPVEVGNPGDRLWLSLIHI